MGSRQVLNRRTVFHLAFCLGDRDHCISGKQKDQQEFGCRVTVSYKKATRIIRDVKENLICGG